MGLLSDTWPVKENEINLKMYLPWGGKRLYTRKTVHWEDYIEKTFLVCVCTLVILVGWLELRNVSHWHCEGVRLTAPYCVNIGLCSNTNLLFLFTLHTIGCSTYSRTFVLCTAGVKHHGFTLACNTWSHLETNDVIKKLQTLLPIELLRGVVSLWMQPSWKTLGQTIFRSLVQCTDHSAKMLPCHWARDAL